MEEEGSEERGGGGVGGGGRRRFPKLFCVVTVGYKDNVDCKSVH